MTKTEYLLIPFILFASIVVGQDTLFTGYSTAFVTDSDIQLKTYGFRNKNKKSNYDSLTIQPVGSVSKIIIGLALMKAVEMGAVHLDTAIDHYINFKVVNPNLKNARPITLKHLATHTSGILDNEKYYIQAYSKGLQSPTSLEEFLVSYLSKDGFRYSRKNFGNHQPGEAYSYSNIGAALAAYVIESATGISFDQFTTEYIFHPLDMKHTHWHYDEAKMDTYAQLYDEKDNPLDFYSLATYPEGSLKTNIIDLSKLLRELIQGYKGNSQLLTKYSWKILFKKNFSEEKPISGINPKEPNSGMFIVYTKNGLIGHTGSDPGVSCFVFFNPETLQGKIMMANEDLTPDNLNSFKNIWENIGLNEDE